MLLTAICQRPKSGLTEVRRDGKDSDAVIMIIKHEFEQCKDWEYADLAKHMLAYSSACWVSRNLGK